MNIEEFLQLPFFYQEGDLLLRAGPNDEVPYAVFEDLLPSNAQVARVTRLGYGIHLLQLPVDNLSFLDGNEDLQHLSVTDVGINTRAVSSLVGLRSLDLMVPGAPETELSGLTNLRRYSGLLDSFSSVLDAPQLDAAEFYDVDLPEIQVPVRLRELHLLGTRRISALGTQETANGAELRRFTIAGAKRFDVASLTAFPRLEILTLERIREVQNIAAISRLSLKELTLIDCRQVDGLPTLLDLQGVQVTITGRLTEGLNDMGRTAQPPWNLYRSV